MSFDTPATNPFCSMKLGGGRWACTCDAPGRLHDVKRFDLKQCRQALKVPGLQKTVVQALERQIRSLEKELEAIQRELADEAARSDIECHMIPQKHSGQHYGKWYDLSVVEPDDVDFIKRAVRYLDWRGLLKRHPENPDLVRPLSP